MMNAECRSTKSSRVDASVGRFRKGRVWEKRRDKKRRSSSSRYRAGLFTQSTQRRCQGDVVA